MQILHGSQGQPKQSFSIKVETRKYVTIVYFLWAQNYKRKDKNLRNELFLHRKQTPGFYKTKCQFLSFWLAEFIFLLPSAAGFGLEILEWLVSVSVLEVYVCQCHIMCQINKVTENKIGVLHTIKVFFICLPVWRCKKYVTHWERC